jgi:hypothetical protein
MRNARIGGAIWALTVESPHARHDKNIFRLPILFAEARQGPAANSSKGGIQVEKFSVDAVARTQLDRASASSSGRRARTLYGGHERLGPGNCREPLATTTVVQAIGSGIETARLADSPHNACTVSSRRGRVLA